MNPDDVMRIKMEPDPGCPPLVAPKVGDVLTFNLPGHSPMRFIATASEQNEDGSVTVAVVSDPSNESKEES